MFFFQNFSSSSIIQIPRTKKELKSIFQFEEKKNKEKLKEFKMNQIIINDKFHQICDNDDDVKILLCIEDGQEMLVFRIDVSSFEDENNEDYKALREILIALRDYEDPHLLRVLDADIEHDEVCFLFVLMFTVFIDNIYFIDIPQKNLYIY